MNTRLIFGVLAMLVIALAAAGVGTAVYNAGVSAGVADAAQQAIASRSSLTAPRTRCATPRRVAA